MYGVKHQKLYHLFHNVHPIN